MTQRHHQVSTPARVTAHEAENLEHTCTACRQLSEPESVPSSCPSWLKTLPAAGLVSASSGWLVWSQSLPCKAGLSESDACLLLFSLAGRGP